jgi:mRNA-degrading endonuclease RelE of RelBE toxin-antitoxin system
MSCKQRIGQSFPKWKRLPRKIKKKIKNHFMKKLNFLKDDGVFQFGKAKLNKNNKVI